MSLSENLGETKRLILRECLIPKRWTELLNLASISEPTLKTHLDDLLAKELLAKTEQGEYRTTDTGTLYLQYIPHVRAPVPPKKIAFEVLRIIARGIKPIKLSARELIEVDLLGGFPVDFGVDKDLRRLYDNVALAIRNSVTIWLPEGLQPDKDVHRAVNRLIAKQLKLSKPDELGTLHIVIDFDLPLALDTVIGQEPDQNVKNRLVKNRERILKVLYKKWEEIFR